MRTAAVVAVVLALAGMVVGVVEANNENSSWSREVGWLLIAITVLTLLLMTLLLLGATCVRAALRRRGGAERVRPSLTALLFAVAAALVMATPVSVYWDDGCNGHGANVALVDAPRIWLTEPGAFALAYQGAETLVDCE